MSAHGNPMDHILRLWASGKEYKARSISMSQGIDWETVEAERSYRALRDVAAWKLLGNRIIGERKP